MLVLVGLARVEVALASRFRFAGVGEGSWLKSKNSCSGSMHWLLCGLYDGAMIIAGCTAVAMLCLVVSGSRWACFCRSLGRQVEASRVWSCGTLEGDQGG
jgi:hypothetical protein